jgi:hypothetical protein
MVWRIEIAPEEFKRFGDCNRDELGGGGAPISVVELINTVAEQQTKGRNA